MAIEFSSRWLRWLLIGIVVLVTALALLVVDRSGALLFRVIGIIGMALFALSVVTMLLTFRRARKLSPWSLLIGAVVACTLIFFALASAPLSMAAILLAISAGAMVAIGWSLTNLLFVDGEAIRARGNAWRRS